jgi:hypothetical protein
MKRRQFLHTTAAAGALAAIPLGSAIARQAARPRFTLAHSGTATAGAAFRAIAQADCADCGADTLRVRLDGLHPAHDGLVLQEFGLSAIFETPGARTPFLAWQHVAGAQQRRSQRLSFVAGRATLRGFELEYRIAGMSMCANEACSLTRFDAPLLAPGHYVLAGPRRNGERVDPSQLRHSGDIAAPLLETGVPRDFDYLALRIEAIA